MTSDLALQQRVIEELDFEPAVNAAHIGVSAEGGVVTLTGHVGSYLEKYEAERAVRRVKGVKAVAQELEVRLAGDRKTADDEIAMRAIKILNWDAIVPADRISVRVEHGVVTLTGDVDWAYQRAEAELDMRKLGGVKDVINSILVKPAIQPANVKAKIRAAFERNADLEAGRISVTVSGSTVKLAGEVTNWTEAGAAERAAWSVPGITEVEDHIKVVRP